jgi:hypothetical protein
LDRLGNNELLNERILMDFNLKKQSEKKSYSLLDKPKPEDLEGSDEEVQPEGFEVVYPIPDEEVQPEGFEVVYPIPDEEVQPEGFEVVYPIPDEEVQSEGFKAFDVEVSSDSGKVCFSSDIKKMEEELSLDANTKLGEDLRLSNAWEYTEFRPFLQEEITQNFFCSEEDDCSNKEKEHLYCAVDYSFIKIKGNANACGLNVGTYLYMKLKEGNKYFLHFKEYEFFINIKRYSKKSKLLL